MIADSICMAICCSPVVIVTRDGVEYIADIRSLGNEKLGVVEDYASDELLQLAFSELNLQRFGSSRQGLRALAGGEIYAFVDNLTLASFVIKTEGLANLKISGQTPYSFDLSIGIRNDWPLLASAIEKALATITPEALVKRADRQLYQAKLAGRNSVFWHQ